MSRRVFLQSLGLLVLAGCALPADFSMYPAPLLADREPDGNVAVVLVGNSGSAAIDYLQFTHASMPAINVKDLDLAPNSIAAVPIPVGTKKLSLNSYTQRGRPAGYLPSGMNYGYIPVVSPAIDVDAKGLYYAATVLTDSRSHAAAPDAAALRQFRRMFPRLAQLKPMNFSWPA